MLVVGAGIAGVTVAQLLRRGGRHPVIIERAHDASAAGYMLALMPMVDAAIDDLGIRTRYRASSVSFDRYAVHGHTGRMLREDSMAEVIASYGDYRGIARGALLDVLSAEGCPVTFDSTVSALNENPGAVEVGITTDGVTHQLEFDLVVIADGIGSTTRELVPAYRPAAVTDTKWGGWVVWSPGDDDSDLGEEVWGDGFSSACIPSPGSWGSFSAARAPTPQWGRDRSSSASAASSRRSTRGSRMR